MQRFTDKKADQLTIRRLNMSAILRLLQERGTLARADLAKELGMTRNTASNIVADLLGAGLVVETEYRREGAGRPGLLLELAPNAGFAVGVEIDISRTIVVAVDFKGNILWKESVQNSREQTQSDMTGTAEQLIREALSWGESENLRLLGIGVGLAGMVDAAGENLVYAPTLNWGILPLKQLWEELFCAPVYLGNEANTSALGYYNYADNSKADNLVYLSIGVGMAAGLMLDGHLFLGTGGFAGQVGHMKIRPDGEPCNCGDHGCWVTEVSLTAFARQLGKTNVNPEEIAQAMRSKDQQLSIILDEMAAMLGIGIVNLINLFNLDTIILGGAMRPILPFLLEKTKAVVDQRALKHPRANVRIKVSGRDDDSVFGAACLVLNAIMNNPITLVRGKT